MEAVTLIIAVVALVLAVIAFVRTGGDLRRQFEMLSSKTETARDKTADALDRLEQLIRGKGKPPETGGGSSGSSTPNELR